MLLSITLVILGVTLTYSAIKNGCGKMAFIGSMVVVLGVAI